MTVDDVYRHIRGVCFKTGPPGTVGAETEWLVVDAADPAAHVPAARVRALVGAAAPPPHRQLRAGRAAGAQLPAPRRARRAPRRARPGHRARARRPRPGRARPRRPRRRPRPRPALPGRPPPLRLHARVLPLRRLPRRRDGHDVLDRVGPGQPGHRRGPRRRGPSLAARARARPGPRRRVRELADARRAPDRPALLPAGHLDRARPLPHPPRPAGGRRRRPRRGVDAVRARRAGHAAAHPRGEVGVRPRNVVPGVARQGGARRGRPRLPPVHAVPAGPPARLAGAADDRRAARPVLAGPRRRRHRAAGRPGRLAGRRGRGRAGRAPVGGGRPPRPGASAARRRRAGLLRRGAGRAAPARRARPRPARGRVRPPLRRAGTHTGRRPVPRPGRAAATAVRGGSDMTPANRRPAPADAAPTGALPTGPLPADEDALKELIAGELGAVRDRSLGLTTEVLDEEELVSQVSPLMSPLVWALAHVGNYEELWLLRAAAGREAMRPEIDGLYDAFEHPRAERPSLPLLPPAEARSYIGTVRAEVLDSLASVRFDTPDPLTSGGFVYGMVVQHEHMHDETMLATHQLRKGAPALLDPVPGAPGGKAERDHSSASETGEILIEAGPFQMGTSDDP